MASPFNLFGATNADVLVKFNVGAYVPTEADLGGSAAIQDCLADAEDQFLRAMPPELFRMITDPQLELVESSAIDGQTVVNLGMTPVVANKTFIWRGVPAQFSRDRPQLQTDRLVDYPPSYGAGAPPTPIYGPAYNLTPEGNWSINVATGAITLVQPLQATNVVYCTYRVDTASPNFVMRSLVDQMTMLAAASLGTKLYARGDSMWAYIEDLRTGGQACLEAMNKGEWIPQELRRLRWWKPVEKIAEGQIGSVRKFRA